MIRSFASFCPLAAVCMAASTLLAAEPPDRIADDKHSLAPLQAYVGQWRGVGQVRRGSSRGAWTEVADWSWRFGKGRAEMVAKLSDGKYFSQLRLQAGDAPDKFVLFATAAKTAAPAESAEPVRYEGSRNGEALVFESVETVDPLPARISIRLVAGGDRMVVLYERRLGDVFTRLGEVGATRVGSSFATAAASGPECVVTGGLGTIAVEYEGKKYFVCCSGCRELFDDDPAGVLAEYHQRKVEEKAQREKRD